MIIYNTTFHVSDEVERMFLDFIRIQYVPRATADGTMTNPILSRVMGSAHDGGTSYALQMQAPTVKALQQWCLSTGKDLSARVTTHFGSSVVGFNTMMDVLDLK
ncbi:MAG: DUF4286 family protein [Bacteroidales bacterium]|nr:DUF4286 family protein [Bacteroidales bacterium]